MNYYDEVDIDVYDRTITSHPLVDSCNALIIFRLLEEIGFSFAKKTVLDVGTGSGQMVRLLKGIPNLSVEACDTDPHVEAYFRKHPELESTPFYLCNILDNPPPKYYDAIVCRGVYHHIPKRLRPEFLRSMKNIAKLVIVADEGILEYSNNDMRKKHCEGWYGYVIEESKRRGLDDLAELEESFKEHEYLETAEDGGDYKESPMHFLEDAGQVNLHPDKLDRLGNWKIGGGFFIATFK